MVADCVELGCSVEVSVVMEEWLAGGKLCGVGVLWLVDGSEWGWRWCCWRAVCARGVGKGCDRSLRVVRRGWVCWMGGVCELIFVFTEGIEASVGCLWVSSA